MKSLRDKIADIIWTATENYEMGAEPSCGSVADAIMYLLKREGIMKWYRWKWWRIAIADQDRGSSVYEDNKEWHRVVWCIWVQF